MQQPPALRYTLALKHLILLPNHCIDSRFNLDSILQISQGQQGKSPNPVGSIAGKLENYNIENSLTAENPDIFYNYGFKCLLSDTKLIHFRKDVQVQQILQMSRFQLNDTFGTVCNVVTTATILQI